MSKSNISIGELNHAIMYGQFTDDQLNSIWMAVKYAKAQQAKVNMYYTKVGDTVKFSNKGRTIVGTVLKKGQKFVQVKEGITVWRVPANMLEAA